jgi:hypothetical protein
VRPSSRPDMDKAESFHHAMEGKIKDPKVAEAYDYWRAATLFKWMALPPKAPDAILGTYRNAFQKIVVDRDFIAQAETSMPGFTVISADATLKIVQDLAKTTDAALEVMDDLMRKQGLNIAKAQTKEVGAAR